MARVQFIEMKTRFNPPAGSRPVDFKHFAVETPPAERFAVIADIHNSDMSQALFLMFCRQANIHQVVSLGDEGDKESIYRAFSDFSNESPENVFIGVRGNWTWCKPFEAHYPPPMQEKDYPSPDLEES